MSNRLNITTKMIEDRNKYLFKVSELTGVAVDDVMSNSRKSDVSLARQYLAWVLHRWLGYSTTVVGRLIRRHHSDVIYSSAKINDGYPDSLVKEIKEKLIEFSKQQDDEQKT